MSGSGSSSAGAGAATSWVGIPDPADTLGYDPINDEPPEDPANWPSAAATGFYYVDSGHVSATDSGNTYGYPNQPRATIPTSLSIDGGKKCVVVGDGESYTGGNINITSSDATAENPAWFVGRSATDITDKTNRPIMSSRELNLGSNYVIASDVKVEHQDSSGAVIGMTNYTTVRNFELEGTGADIGSSNGSGISPPSNSCLYNGEIHDLGEWETNSNGDYHAIKSSGTVSNVWVLNITGYHCQGDTIQIGDANGNAATVTNFYLGNVIGYENKENTMDLKDCTDIIISGGEGSLMSTLWGDDAGADIVVHDEANYVWIIGRKMHDSSRAVIVSDQATNVYICNSVFYDYVSTGGTGYFDPGTAISIQQNQAYVANCTFYNCRKGLEFTVGTSNPYVRNCIFAERAEVGSDYFDFGIENSTDISNADVDYNMYSTSPGMLCRGGGTEYTSIASWRAATPCDDNSSEAAPTFTDAANDDYSLAAGSNGLASGSPTKPTPFTAFASRHGFSIEYDIDGNARPASGSDWDLGAYQR